MAAGEGDEQRVAASRDYSPRRRPGMIHNLYIFDRNGQCLYYKEWNRDQYTLRESPDEDRKLVFGLIFSLKQFVTSLSPRPYPASPPLQRASLPARCAAP